MVKTLSDRRMSFTEHIKVKTIIHSYLYNSEKLLKYTTCILFMLGF